MKPRRFLRVTKQVGSLLLLLGPVIAIGSVTLGASPALASAPSCGTDYGGVDSATNSGPPGDEPWGGIEAVINHYNPKLCTADGAGGQQFSDDYVNESSAGNPYSQFASAGDI